MITITPCTGNLGPAGASLLAWCVARCERHHYLRSFPDPRSRPLCYAALLDGEPVGCLWFGRTESTRCYQGGLTFGSQGDVTAGRAAFDRWEVLALSRLWLSPDVQAGGRLCSPDRVPGFTDRKGVWRSALATHLIGRTLASVGLDYLLAHPPCFLHQPYMIRAVLSYCDTRLHRGTVYRSAGWLLSRANDDGIETWWTPRVRSLSPEEDARVRQAAEDCPRSWRIRNERRSLFDGLEVPNAH